jgi:hypothetical protein
MRAIAVLKLVQTLDQLEESARIACAEPDGSQLPLSDGFRILRFTFREAVSRPPPQSTVGRSAADRAGRSERESARAMAARARRRGQKSFPSCSMNARKG